MSNIFISYSTKDKKIVKKLYNDLIKAGNNVWIDEYKIKVGDDIMSEIETGIAESDFIIVAHLFKFLLD